MSFLGERLRIERKRLGLTQPEMASVGETTKKSQIDYEKGNSSPKASYLQAIHKQGADIMFIVTGERVSNTLTNEELGVLELWRSASFPAKSAAWGALQANEKTVEVAGQNITNQTAARDVNNVSGNVNHLGDVINTQKHTKKIIEHTSPGIEHISEEQKRILKNKVDEIVELEKQLKQRPKAYAAVWSALNKTCGVTRYALIKHKDYEKAVKYLNQWMGRLNRMPSASKKAPETWRNKKYAYIKINTKDDVSAMRLRKYISSKFGVNSISQLTNDQLEKTYNYVASLKR